VVIRVHGQPGFAGTKAGVDRSVPLHWRTATIATLVKGPVTLARWVLDVFSGDFDIAHTDFFTIIYIGRASDGEQHGCQELQTTVIFVVGVTVAERGTS